LTGSSKGDRSKNVKLPANYPFMVPSTIRSVMVDTCFVPRIIGFSEPGHFMFERGNAHLSNRRMNDMMVNFGLFTAS